MTAIDCRNDAARCQSDGDLSCRCAAGAAVWDLKAASVRRWNLVAGANWRQLDIVVADDEEQAERRFFRSLDRQAAKT